MVRAQTNVNWVCQGHNIRAIIEHHKKDLVRVMANARIWSAESAICYSITSAVEDKLPKLAPEVTYDTRKKVPVLDKELLTLGPLSIGLLNGRVSD